ncbi:MAG: nitroreductase family protein [Thermodesulfobacteriota bacterium]
MEAAECIKTRRSIRKFKSEPVPKGVLMEVIDIARWSPSYKNSQPWEVAVVSGTKKEALSGLLIELLESGREKDPDLPEPKFWPDPEGQRITELIEQRKAALGIDLSDPEVIRQARMANFKFYGAPHVIYLYQDSSLSLWSLFDLGLFAQSLMLAAHDKGLGTVPQGFVTDYAAEVKRFLAIPESKRLVLGLSIGYPDLEDRVNKLRTERGAVPEFVNWLE